VDPTRAAVASLPASLAGSALVLPAGWSGRWDIHETLRKLYVTIDRA